MSRCFALIAFTSMLLPGVAYAQGDCPDGDWFCEPAEPAAEPAESPDAAPPEEAEAAPPPPAPARKPVPVIVVDRAEHKPKPPRRRFFREWGFNLHLAGALMGSHPDADPDAEMGGLGLGLRYRPRPHFAFDASAEFIGGTDFNGYERDERSLLLNAMVFFNPWSKFQVYALGGIGFSGADVEIAPREGEGDFEPFTEEYTYFGGQLGIGAEIRISRRVAIGGDILGFVRGRTDDSAKDQPEFVDPDSHRATNTSGGGLVRVGVTFYW